MQILHHFCKDGDPSRQTTASVMANLIDQLVDSRETKPLVEILKKARQTSNVDRCSNFQTLWGVFVQMIEEFPLPVLVVVDALDECAEPEDLINRVLRLGGTKKARFCLTSRPLHEISTLFNQGHVHTPSIEMRVSDETIRHYLSLQIEKNFTRLGPFKEEITTKVPGNAGGMFRYAALMLDDLDNRPDQDVEDILRCPPNGLNGMYEHILIKLDQANIHLQEMRRRVLLWVAIAMRPINISEMAYACATKDSEKHFDPSKRILRTEPEIISLCGPLIEVFDSRKYDRRRHLRFTHQSVKNFIFERLKDAAPVNPTVDQYLIKDPAESHASVAIACRKPHTSYVSVNTYCKNSYTNTSR